MKILHSLPDTPLNNRTVVALGNFDGVHRGHQVLISRAVQLARQINGQSVVLTFDPHPLELLKPEAPTKLILTAKRKRIKIAELGADILLFLPFTRELASMAPDDFGTMIYQALRTSNIVVGFNYSYGYRGQGSPETLMALGQKLGFKVEIVPPQTDGGELISSTRIRQALVEGEVEKAKQFLGYWPILEGKVVSGDGRGRNLGFPTANVEIPGKILLPRVGVYAAKCCVGAQSYLAVVNIGSKPTFKKEQTPLVEAHLLDFNGNIYDQEIEIHLLKYLRPEKKFTNAESLKEQVARDIKVARLAYGDL